MLSFLFAVAEGLVEVATVIVAAAIADETCEVGKELLKDKRS